MAARASTTWKNTTALTLTVTLSSVTTSWVGTSWAITRRSTLVRRSTPNGRMKKMPGPFRSIRRPRAEHHAALVLPRDPDAAPRDQQQEHNDDDQDHGNDRVH